MICSMPPAIRQLVQIVVCAFTIAQAALAQPAITQPAITRSALVQPGGGYRVETFTTEDGLPSQVITAIAQASDGYVWIVAGGILVRFDGHTFRDVFKAQTRSSGGKVEFSESLNKATDKIELAGGVQATREGDIWHILLSAYLLDWVDVPDETSALGLAMALSARAGTEAKLVDRAALLDMPIPPDAETRAAYAAAVKKYRKSDHAGAIEAAVDRIDALIGPCLGLDEADIAAIRKDMLEDPFLKNITPRWPATENRIQGYRTGLDSPDRYS